MNQTRKHNDMIREREIISKQLVELAKLDKLRKKQECNNYINPLYNNNNSNNPQASNNPIYKLSNNSLPSTSTPSSISERSISSSQGSVTWTDIYEPVMSKAERSKIRWHVASLIEPTIENITNMNEMSLQELMASTNKAFAQSRNSSLKFGSIRSAISGRNSSARSNHTVNNSNRTNITDNYDNEPEQDEIQDNAEEEDNNNNNDENEEDEIPSPIAVASSTRTVSISKNTSMPSLVRQPSDSNATPKRGILKRTGPSINEYTYEDEMDLKKATTFRTK